jgi:hypothetical protein
VLGVADVATRELGNVAAEPPGEGDNGQDTGNCSTTAPSTCTP